MSKNYSIIKILFTGLVMIFFACHKDDQEFNFKNINNLTIETPAETNITRSLNDSLILTPKLLETMPAGDEYNYSWKVGDSLVSTAKDLRMKVELPIANHAIVFVATNKKSGVQALYRYTLTVRGTYYSGIFITHNKAGQAHFSFVRADDVYFADPIKEVNNKIYPGTALSLSYSSPHLMLFTTEGVWRLHHDDLKEIQDISSILPSFSSFPIAKKPYFGYTSSLSIDQVLIMEGSLYGAGGTFSGDATGAFSDRYAGDYELYPAIFPLQYPSPTYFYDNKNKRFMTMALQQRTIAIAPATATSSFNMASVGRTLVAHYNTGNNSSSEVFYLMSDGTDYYLMSNYNTAFAAQGATTVGINQKIEVSGISSVKKFAVNGNTSTRMYFGVDNGVYLYDILAKSVSKIYDLPAGYTIKDIRMSGTNRLIVAAGTNSIGELFFFDLTSGGSFVNNTYAKKYEGFGNIVEISQR